MEACRYPQLVSATHSNSHALNYLTGLENYIGKDV